MNPRYLAVLLIEKVIYQGKSLNEIVPEINEKIKDDKDRALCRELISGVVRWHYQLLSFQFKSLEKPKKQKDILISCLLSVGLYQIFFMRVADHAAVNESVNIAKKIKKAWAKNLVNAVLRKCLREKSNLLESLKNDEVANYSHPAWLINILKQDYENNWKTILSENNHQAPMVLRVNQRVQPVNEYLSKLQTENISGVGIDKIPSAVKLLKACDIQKLPGFCRGSVSVQDSAAQMAATLLNLQSGQRVLDACAAPGGKTAHILETENVNLLAVESNKQRIQRITETLNRLSLSAEIKLADASIPSEWWDGELFDRILLDAPCSGTGVIRRNPDIKIHRTLEDITQLVENQHKIINSLWNTLKPGGLLLYATCSVLKIENENQIGRFLKENSNAKEIEIAWESDNFAQYGLQILPGENDMDGFYYALLEKQENASN